jgi:hypothetical protein
MIVNHPGLAKEIFSAACARLSAGPPPRIASICRQKAARAAGMMCRKRIEISRKVCEKNAKKKEELHTHRHSCARELPRLRVLRASDLRQHFDCVWVWQSGNFSSHSRYFSAAAALSGERKQKKKPATKSFWQARV